MKLLQKLILTIVAVIALAVPGYAQQGGPVNVKATDTSTGASTEVGDNTNHALRVNVVAGGSNSAASATGSAVPANADYVGINVAGNLRGATGVNPSGSIYATQVDLASVAGSTISQGHGTAATAIRVELPTDGTGIVGLAAGTNVIGHVILDSGTTTVTQGTGSNLHTVVDSGTITTVSTVTALTSITNAVITKPIDACSTTNEDFQGLVADTTLDTVTSTTTCVDSIVISNKGTASTTVLLQDISGTPLVLVPTTTIAPGASLTLSGLAGTKMTSGIKVQANNANNLTYWIKGRQ